MPACATPTEPSSCTQLAEPIDRPLGALLLEYDGEVCLRARYYQPPTGRFNRVDPFAGNTSDPQSLHKYVYAHANPVIVVDPSGLFSVSELGSVGGIQNILAVGTNFISNVFRAVNIAKRFIELIDTAKMIIRFGSAIGAASSPAGAAVALAAELRNQFGLDNVNSITDGFDQVAKSIGPNWPKIARRIRDESFKIAEEVALALVVANKMPRYLAAEAKGDLQFILFAPSGPGNGNRKGDKIISATDRFAVGVSPSGGRLFGFGVRTTRRASAGYDQWFRIDYYDRNQNPPLSVHYHVFGDEIKHPDGRIIWRP